MLRILIDTCVWLELAKSRKQKATLGVIEELVQMGEISLILPRTILQEFERNKDRIIKEAGRSLSDLFKNVKKVVADFGDADKKGLALDVLNDVDYKIPLLGEAAVDSVGRIEALFEISEVLDVSNEAKLRAVDRGSQKKAPFVRGKNGTNDALLIETYGDVVRSDAECLNQYAFVTFNTHDFGNPDGDQREPHPDIAELFEAANSHFFIQIVTALERFQADLVTDLMLEHDWYEESRPLGEISDAISELLDKIWYNRHKVWEEKIENGEIDLVDKETFPVKDHARRPIQKDVWKRATEAAAMKEKEYGIENLGPWDDFEWGMMNGKLSALRWVLGDDWDMLDT
jgi:hypothetical protein